jgi:putative FmdB family regulatory protein
MPLFEFRCSGCARDFGVLVRAGEAAACPECGTRSLEKLFSEAAPPAATGSRPLPMASTCPPGEAPCSPTCCRL